VIAVGGAVVWLESESAIDKARTRNLGIDLSKMVVWTPDTLEDGFRFIEKIIGNIASDKDLQGKPTLIVWDTISMARTEAERDGDAFRDGIGAGPRAISSALKKYAQELTHHNVHLLLVNQSYTNINAGPYGKQFETPGGKRIKFASTTRIHLKRAGWIGDKRTLGPQDEKTGILVRANTVKNKVALGQRRVELALYGKTGVSEVMTLAHAFVEGNYKWPEGLEVKSGGRYQLVGINRSVFWGDIEKAVLESPETLEAWRARALAVFPVHPSRQRNSDGWYARVDNYDDSGFIEASKLSAELPVFEYPAVPLAPPLPKKI
jgi:RecA/RadA recombinase